MRRSFDVVCAVLGLIFLLPLFAAIAALIKLVDNGPIFYRGERVGLNNRVFRLFKFRTMVVNADRNGPGITHASDQRITATGRFLRRYKLDEFPQLINVIRGEMSLVGPRPEDPRYTAFYDPAQQLILSVRPGITSPASLYYKNESSFLTQPDWEERYIKEIMPKKIAIDLKYFEHNTFQNDLAVIFQTVLHIFR